MDVSSMLSNGAQDAPEATDIRRQSHQYPTRNVTTTQDQDCFVKPYSPAMQRPLRGNGVPPSGPEYPRASPAKKGQRHVVFQLIDTENPNIQARLPMRVMISKHDNTDSIITTVKNFYGLYDYGVSFENKDGVSIIAAYDNFENDMTVYVRTVAQPSTGTDDVARDSASPKKPSLGAPFEMRPTLQHQNQSPSKSGARSAGVRSMSPQSDIGKRSASAAPGGKPRPQRTKSKDNSVMGDAEGYSSGDNGEGSVASSRRSKVEQVNAEISVENIVEGGRRKRAFESSELPLFVPPQVPISASISSISPQRRAGPMNAASPYTYSNQQTFSYYTQPLPSPQSYGGAHQQPGYGNFSSGFSAPYQPPRQLRGRPSATYPPNRASTGGILPTPDPTVGSAISDEDVALQLMRLGDPLAFSHGRTSTSTIDDALSGKADAASSDEDDDDEEEDEEQSRLPAVPRFSRDSTGPQRKKQRLTNNVASDGTSGEEYEDQRDTTFAGYGDGRKIKSNTKPRSLTASSSGYGASKLTKTWSNNSSMPKLTKHNKHHQHPPTKVPISPSSMPAPSRKGSIASTLNFQHALGDDEEDLSSKPRCQRCRKSKKGCDRQRPCGRCKDAGIGIEGCISEDEGNGRKGRYGRHMGVPVKKGEEGFAGDEADGEDGDSAMEMGGASPGGVFLAPALPGKDRKRKR